MDNIENTNISNKVENITDDKENVALDDKEVIKKEKSFTQEEVNKIVNERLAQEKKRNEKAKKEAIELAKLSEDERQAKLFEKQKSELEAREKEILKKELEIETSEQLKKLGISTKGTKFVLGTDAESTFKNINEFNNFINEIKADYKKELLKGKTPLVSTGAEASTLTKEQFSKMSAREQTEIFRSNKDLYMKLIKR